jgi:hypothetical protein
MPSDSTKHLDIRSVLAGFVIAGAVLYAFLAGYESMLPSAFDFEQKQLTGNATTSLWIRTILVAALVGLAHMLRMLKKRTPRGYALLELVTGIVISWINLGKGFNFHETDFPQRLAILIGAVYLLKRGFDAYKEAGETSNTTPRLP